MDKKGFVLSTYVYMLLVFFLLLLGTMLAVLNNSKLLSNKLKEQSGNTSGLLDNEYSFILLGDKEMDIIKDTEYEEPGFIAKTTKGVDISTYVSVIGNVDTSIEEKYTLTYKITYNGVSSVLKRVVNVRRPFATDYIKDLLKDEETLNNGLVQIYATVNGDEVDAGIRYAGATSDVKNQVYFNCAETDGTNAYGTENYDYANNCEIWRIIGVFNTKSSETDTTGTPKIKIVRDEVLSTSMAWDTTADGVDYINQWGATTLADGTTPYRGASLMQYLNGNTEGNYYYSLSSIAKGQIDEVLWYTGAVADGTASGVYEDERSNATGTGTTVNYTTIWVGKIGLIYPSDYGYAGTNCSNYTIISYSSAGSCGKTSNWLTSTSGSYWTISSRDSSNFSSWEVRPDGYASGSYVSNINGVRPALYLDSNVQIIGGDGGSKPYILK